MKSISITKPGGPEVLKLVESEVPVPAEGEILIKVMTAGVNRPDCIQRQGLYPAPKGASLIPGLEVAGTVVKIGANAGKFSVGERVCALVTGGGYAEYCTAHQDNALPIPAGLTVDQAAALPETYFTVWHNVFQRGGLKKGETILIHGGTSGIGTTAIQLAKAFGATVFATAGSHEKCLACIDLGADYAIDYKRDAFETVIKEKTKGKGVDLILDMVGGSYINRNYDAAAVGGRIVQIAFLNGSKNEVDFIKLMVKRLTHTGSTMRARSVDFKAQIASELQQMVWPLISHGTIRPIIDKTFPLADAALAHAYMEESKHIGKIMLSVADD